MSLDLSKLEKVNKKGDKIIARCPACWESGADETGDHLVIMPSGKFGCCINEGDHAHRKRIFELAGVKEEGFRNNGAVPPPLKYDWSWLPRLNGVGHPVAYYAYRDAFGKELYRIVRYDPKTFRPFRPVNGKWEPGLEGVEMVPYHLPEIIEAETVWIVEGEKDADNLRAIGVYATTRATGGNAWEPELTRWFAGKKVILCGDNDTTAKGKKYMDKVEAALVGTAVSIQRVEIPSPAKDISDVLEGLSDEEARAKVNDLLVDPIDLDLEKRRFDIHKPPQRIDPVLFIRDIGIAKSGDLVVISAQVKAGKSAMLGAMMGCLMGNGRLDCDFLGVRGSNPRGWPVLHFDTEQNREDYFDLLARSLARAKLDEPPSWFFSYFLTDLDVKKRRQYIFHEIRRQIELHGALCAAFVDGVADCCENVNDPAEANKLVDDLYAAAIAASGPLVAVLHENPGTEFGKTRGHLGSQLERKAASNLRLAKDEAGTIQLFSEKLRRGMIAKGTGPHFRWDDDSEMHLSVESSHDVKAKERDRQKMREFSELAVNVFAVVASGALRHSDLVESIMKTADCSQKTARRRIEQMRNWNILNYLSSYYSVNSAFKIPA
jgi:5S rRNA maturation endonuclease (ribonuclease M5)